jgi:hypothetical protein
MGSRLLSTKCRYSDSVVDWLYSTAKTASARRDTAKPTSAAKPGALKSFRESDSWSVTKLYHSLLARAKSQLPRKPTEPRGRPNRKSAEPKSATGADGGGEVSCARASPAIARPSTTTTQSVICRMLPPDDGTSTA